MNAFCYCILLTIILLSCHNEQKEKTKQITHLVNEWQGKQIVFPENLIFTRYLIDTTDFQIPQSGYKVLIYVDSMGCTGCKLRLHKWKELIEYTDSATQGKVPFLFFLHSKDTNEIHSLLKYEVFDRPVCIDIDDRINKLNKIPADIRCQTFLLDKDNKVAILGNPVYNTAVKDLYLKKITGKDNSNKNIPKTTVEVTQTVIDFGIFDKSETKEITIDIKNTGKTPLVIMDVSTTCGCTVTTYEKQPVQPGESLWVQIKMSPKDTGFFDEVVTIRYNSINNQPVKVKIKGNVQ